MSLRAQLIITHTAAEVVELGLTPGVRRPNRRDADH